jgi:hypothetical protein
VATKRISVWVSVRRLVAWMLLECPEGGIGHGRRAPNATSGDPRRTSRGWRADTRSRPSTTALHEWPATTEAFGHGNTVAVSPLAQRIAHAVYQNTPDLHCFACLAERQGVNEHDVRAIALILIMRGGLQLVRRVCSRCQRSGEALAPQKVA